MSDLTRMVKNGILEMVEGVYEMTEEAKDRYIDRLVKAKENEIELKFVPGPSVTTNAQIGLEGSIATASSGGFNLGLGVGGEVAGFGLKLEGGGNYSKEKSEGARLKMDVQVLAGEAPDYEGMKSLSVDALLKLKTIGDLPKEADA